MGLYSHLYTYTAGVQSGAFDKDLSPEDRAAVLRILYMALAVMADYGGTPASELTRMMHDPYGSTDAVNRRVAEIIAGCAQ